MQLDIQQALHFKKIPWYRSPLPLMGLLFISVMTWFVILMVAVGEFAINPTTLILKSDACRFLQQNGVVTEDYPDTNTCRVTAPFRTSLLSNDGLILINDQTINVSASQIVIVGSVEQAAWTPSQQRSVIAVTISSLVMLSLLIWIVSVILSSAKESSHHEYS